MEKFAIKQLVAVTYKIDNSADATRTYDIAADAHAEDGKVKYIQNGYVKAKDDENKQNLADFNDYGGLSANIYDSGENTDRVAIFNAIAGFCADLRAEELPTTLNN